MPKRCGKQEDMRDIRFRAWDKDDKYMTKPFLLSEIDNGEIEEGTLHVDELELMQFTGLKDKNGIPIFEGDIMAGSDHAHFGEVKWNQTEARWKMYIKEEKSFGLEYGHARLIEIIGNIYENPELLK